MKTKLYLIILTLLMTTAVLAQAPEKFKYQGVVHDNNGNPFNDRIISLRISLLQEFVNGNAIYIEKHNTSTNKFGLFNINVGEGSVISGNFSTIPWSKYQYFQKVEIDTTGDTTGVGNFIFMGTSQLLSVPYALDANYSDSCRASSISEYTRYSGFTNMWVYNNPGENIFTQNSGEGNYMVEVWGGGGGGGASWIDTTNNSRSCGGGGGYGKIIFHLYAGDSFTFFIGAGGLGNCMGSGSDGETSYFGTLISATGGHGGDPQSDFSIGGTSNGPLNISGGYGTGNGFVGAIWGGDSPNGGNGGVSGVNGSNGVANGMAPGGGGCAWYENNGNSHAGNGANGRVVIYF
jgi:hypothetical protein